MWSIFADSLSAFAEQALLVSEGSFFIFGLGWRMFTIQLNLVVDLCFGRQQFGREIKRNTRFGFRLIKREPFAHAAYQIPETVAASPAPTWVQERAIGNL